MLTAAPSERFAAARTLMSRRKPREDWFFSVRTPDGSRYLRWQGLFEFLVSRDGRQILFHRHPRATADSFAAYLLGQVISFALLARGMEALHGTVNVVGGKAAVFVGESGEGKSTLAAAMLTRGFPVLTDDLVVLDDGDDTLTVHAGVPRIKLFPSIARKVLKSNLRASTLNNGTAKLVLPLSRGQVERGRVPIGGIYVLSRPKHERARSADAVRVEPLEGSEAFLEVIRSAFNLVVHDPSRLATQFTFASGLVDRVRIRRLIYPRSLPLLPMVCDAVVEDVSASSDSLARATAIQGIELPS